MNLAVFVSGRGSNLQAILNSAELKDIVDVKVVVSNKQDCKSFEIAKQFSIPTKTLGEKEGQISYSSLSNFLSELKIDLVVLAGFLKLIPVDVIKNFKNRIINIHPALLPSFGGKGMYGINVHKAVFYSSAKVSGPSVHFVDETFDTGKIIAQKCIDISDVKSPEEIAERVLVEEHKILPYVIKKFAEGKIRIFNGRVEII